MIKENDMHMLPSKLEYESGFQVTGYPSKTIGLYSKPSMIFRSDSNGEDLEGYAGAWLYDWSVSEILFLDWRHG